MRLSCKEAEMTATERRESRRDDMACPNAWRRPIHVKSSQVSHSVL